MASFSTDYMQSPERERKTTIRHEKLRKSAKKKEIMNQLLAFDDRSIYTILCSHSYCVYDKQTNETLLFFFLVGLQWATTTK